VLRHGLLGPARCPVWRETIVAERVEQELGCVVFLLKARLVLRKTHKPALAALFAGYFLPISPPGWRSIARQPPKAATPAGQSAQSPCAGQAPRAAGVRRNRHGRDRRQVTVSALAGDGGPAQAAAPPAIEGQKAASGHLWPAVRHVGVFALVPSQIQINVDGGGRPTRGLGRLSALEFWWAGALIRRPEEGHRDPGSQRIGLATLVESRRLSVDSGRPLCANSGCSRAAWRTGQVDPSLPLKIGRVNGWEAKGSGRSPTTTCRPG
jgi:hypothetical protein